MREMNVCEHEVAKEEKCVVRMARSVCCEGVDKRFLCITFNIQLLSDGEGVEKEDRVERVQRERKLSVRR